MDDTKKSLVNNLQGVKLIIGNGFDLYCGLKTSYSDYFNYDEKKNEKIRTLINEFRETTHFHGFSLNSLDDCLLLENGFLNEDVNFWDVFFYLISGSEKNIKEWKWCDVESSILHYLQESDGSLENSYCFADIYYLLKNEGDYENYAFDVQFLASFVFCKNKDSAEWDLDEYYAFLLNQLNCFENNFGKYISYLPMKYPNNGRDHSGRRQLFEKKCDEAIEKLCSNSLTSIDTFNYDCPLLSGKDVNIHNINGNIDNPIFGIDSNAFASSDARYIFTKTSRRIKLDMSEYKSDFEGDFKNVIIFGCSLALADYSYFFAIFDKLNIVDLSNNSKVVFAFTIYDSEKEEQIKKSLMDSIVKLFEEYSTYKGNERYPNRLLDSLTSQGKILLYKI